MRIVEAMAQAAADFWVHAYKVTRSSFYLAANGRFPDEPIEPPEIFRQVLVEQYTQMLSRIRLPYVSVMDYKPLYGDPLYNAVESAAIKPAHLPGKAAVRFEKGLVQAKTNYGEPWVTIWSDNA